MGRVVTKTQSAEEVTAIVVSRYHQKSYEKTASHTQRTDNLNVNEETASQTQRTSHQNVNEKTASHTQRTSH